MKIAYQIIIIQLSLAVLATVGAEFLWGIQGAGAAAAAGLAAIIPNIVFALKVFAHQGARAANQILRSVYRGELLKIIATVALFLVCIKYLHVMFLPFVLTYGLCLAAFWVAPWLRSTNRVISA